MKVHQPLCHDRIGRGDLRRDRIGELAGRGHAGARMNKGIVHIELRKAECRYGYLNRLRIAIGVLQLDVRIGRIAPKVG